MKFEKPTRALRLTTIFLREQLREPISLLWTLISPCALFYFITYNSAATGFNNDNYAQSTAGFYAYVACTVAFFGVAFYIVGRRESGFIRSFIYTPEAKNIFLISHLACYLISATAYCITFYIITKPAFSPYNLAELVNILYRFLICFIIFCSPALILANCKLKFQSANTAISVLMFTMILLALLTPKAHSHTLEAINHLNIFSTSKNIMNGSTRPEPFLIGASLILALTLAMTSAKLRINPVWSRY